VSKSMQEQLLKAGLANKKQAVRAKKAKNNKEKLKRSGVDVTDDVELSARAAREAQTERDRELNRQKVAQDRDREIAAQIRQLVSLNRIEERGDETFSFNHQGVVKSVMLTAKHRQALVRGSLALIIIDDNFELLPRQVSEKIAERDETCIVVANDKSDEVSEDDEYADYQVPDDLMW